MTGLDISPTALVTAEQRAEDAGVALTFAVADSTKLDGYTEAFDTVIDSGLFHSLDEEGRRRYVAAVHGPPDRAPPCCSAASRTLTRQARSGGRRCPKRRCATSSAGAAGTSWRWSPPRCAANWTVHQSKWRSGTCVPNGADETLIADTVHPHKAKLNVPIKIIATPANLPLTSPRGIVFSNRAKMAIAAIHSRFMTPPTNSSPIRVQQQPTQ